MKKYCPSCGKPNPAAAKFCCNCGSSISLRLENAKGKITPPEEIVDEDEYEEEPIPIEATQLDIEIDYNELPKGETIGQIMASGGPDSPSETYERGGGPEISREQFLEEFRREAGPIRKGPSIGED